MADAALPGGGLGGYALTDDIRFIFSRGAGAKFWDADGREFIDYAAGAGALILGHSPAAVVAAANKQTGRGMHMFGALSDVAVRLAARLARDIPCAEKIAFATTGSEATAYCIRLARAFTGREKILKFEGAYHGNHDYALVSAFSSSADYPAAVADTAGMPGGARDSVLVAPYNDLAAATEIAEAHAADLAAIIAEPVQRIIPGDEEFLRGLRTLASRLDSVLIFDEVVTGFRVAYGGAHSALGIRPDLASFGKIIGAGGPLSVVAGRAEIIDLANPARRGDSSYAYFNGTLHGNPVAAAATSALLDELRTPGFYDSLNANTESFCGEAEKILTRRKMPAIVARAGSLWQFLFCEKPPRNYADIVKSDMAAARRLDSEMLRRGQYMLPGVRRFVSAAHSAEEFETTLRALDESCRAVAR
ncbi:MAG: aspartate aminotransferase family protein [Gammaproteobacteria bacterium]